MCVSVCAHLNLKTLSLYNHFWMSWFQILYCSWPPFFSSYALIFFIYLTFIFIKAVQAYIFKESNISNRIDSFSKTSSSPFSPALRPSLLNVWTHKSFPFPLCISNMLILLPPSSSVSSINFGLHCGRWRLCSLPDDSLPWFHVHASGPPYLALGI